MPTETNAALFPVTWEIGTGLPGAPRLHLAVVVDVVRKLITGQGKVTQAVNPPVDVASSVTGTYTAMTVMPDRTKLLVVATGVPVVHWPPHDGTGPVLLPNLHLRMVLETNWKSGVANYQFLDGRGQWHEVENVPVRQVANAEAQAA